MKLSRRKSKYVIAKTFYSHLGFYLILTLFLILFLSFSISAFAYLAGIPLSDFPLDACDSDSSEFNVLYCFIINSKDSNFYNLFYYFSLILIIICIMALIILNVFYIVNGFYFKRLVKEKSCGAVIYKIENDKVLYLLLKMNYGHTSLCKGHQEEGENDEMTALREIKEETSLDVSLDTNFKTRIRYQPKELAIKDVYFFIATPKDKEVVPVDNHDEEVNSFEWCDYDEALFKITFDSDRNVIKKANRYIKKHKFID